MTAFTQSTEIHNINLAQCYWNWNCIKTHYPCIQMQSPILLCLAKNNSEG